MKTKEELLAEFNNITAKQAEIQNSTPDSYFIYTNKIYLELLEYLKENMQ